MLSWRFIHRHKVRTFLGFVSIALGVALFVSADTANQAIVASAERTVRDLGGAAEWQVVGPGGTGIDPALADAIRKIPGAVAAPLVQVTATLVEPRAGSLIVLGVDFLSDAMLRMYKTQGAADPKTIVATMLVPDGVMLTRRFTERHGMRVGSAVKVSTPQGLKILRVTGIIEDEGPARVFDGNFAVLDLRAAQRIFGRKGLVDRIEVAHASREAILAACPGSNVRPVQRVSSFIQDAVARLESLVAVAVVALLVGVFIIYNTVAVSVVERVKTIGTLRALGATKAQIRNVLLLEWLVLGALGAAAGVALGWILARILVQFAAGTINTLMLSVDVREVALPARTAAAAMVLGVSVAVVAAWWPAREAMSFAPIRILRPYTYRLTRGGRKAFVVGVAIIVTGILAFWLLESYSVTGLACTGLLFVGVALALPLLTRVVSEWLRPHLRKWLRIEGYLGADAVAKFPERTALTATALAGTLAMFVATATLVEGFGLATKRWMDAAFPFDLSVNATDLSATVYSQDSFDASVEGQVAAVEGVDFAYGVRAAFLTFRDKDILAIAVEFDPFLRAQQSRRDGPWLGLLTNAAFAADFRAGRGVAVSENFAFRFGVRVGDEIPVDTPDGTRRMRVLAQLEDYSWPQGVIYLDLSVYRAAFHDDSINYVDLKLLPGADPEAVRARIAETSAGSRQLFVFTVAMLKRGAEDALSSVMVFANVQVLIAITIGFLGIVNTLLISVLQRSREIGLLRAVGMLRRQVARAVLIEAVIVGVIGGAIGIVTGLSGGLGPLRMFTFAMTGYLTPIVIPWWHLLGAFVAAVLIAATAAVIPARRAAGVNVLDAIGYE